MVKGSIQEEDITIINIYVPNIEAPQCIRQLVTAIKEEINSNTIIVGDFNSSLTPVEISQTEKFFFFFFFFLLLAKEYLLDHGLQVHSGSLKIDLCTDYLGISETPGLAQQV